MLKLKHKQKFDDKYLPYLLVAPSIIVICFVLIYPLLKGIYMSFTDYNILRLNNVKFIGFGNYLNLLGDKDFWNVIAFTFIYAFGTTIISYLLGLVVALILNKKIKGRSIFRAVLLIPWIIPWVVAANSWLWILNTETGILKNILTLLGLANSSIDFFGSAISAQITVTLLNAWKSFPFMMLVLLSGLQNIPNGLYEAAYIDGANKWESFIHITLPGLKKVTVLSTILMSIWVFNSFESIYLLTRGGPVTATYTISILTYRSAFYSNKLGYASAVATSLMILMVIMSVIYVKITKSDGQEG